MASQSTGNLKNTIYIPEVMTARGMMLTNEEKLHKAVKSVSVVGIVLEEGSANASADIIKKDEGMRERCIRR